MKTSLIFRGALMPLLIRPGGVDQQLPLLPKAEDTSTTRGQAADDVAPSNQGKNRARGVTGFSPLTHSLMATLGEFDVYFVISKLLILAYFLATNEE